MLEPEPTYQQADLAPALLSPSAVRGVDALRKYLHRTRFHQAYKFIASSNLYCVMPSAINQASRGNVIEFFDSVLANDSGLELLQCLMVGRPLQRAELSDADKATADHLLEANIVGAEDDRIVPSTIQLISAFGVDLMIDRRINFPTGTLHDVYVGIDSYAMLYYLDPKELRPGARALDLCTGSGIAALYMSLFCDDVTATDIGSVALELVQMNRQLNGKQASITVLDQALEDTLDESPQVNMLTCNPPFVAFPPGVNTTLYSHGSDIDGLGYLRDIVQRLPDVLMPGGVAYLVADLVGDMQGPYFLRELREAAARSALSVDVYVDGVIPAKEQLPALTAHLASANPGRDRTELADEVRRFQNEVLKAERYYLSTMRVGNDRRAGEVRLFRRYALNAPAQVEQWPSILLQN
ncbi:MAG: methyltransferase [Gammaproteobacteria bacterium]|nr:methyltransferase [Gammaproteobacteria bacterium]